jgi:hypothetical protein
MTFGKVIFTPIAKNILKYVFLFKQYTRMVLTIFPYCVVYIPKRRQKSIPVTVCDADGTEFTNIVTSDIFLQH